MGRTGHADKLLRPLRNELLLEQTCSSTLDTVQVIVDLVRAVKGYVQHDIVRQLIEQQRREPGGKNHLARLVARRDKDDLGLWVCLLRQVLGNGVDDVLDGAAGANADVGEAGQEVLGDGLVARGAFGGFDEVVGAGHCADEEGVEWIAAD